MRKHHSLEEGRKREMLDLELYKKIINENPQLDRVVLMNWGEPLLHPHLVEMISYAHKKNIERKVGLIGV